MSRLQDALRRGAKTGDYAKALRGNVAPRGIADAKAVGQVLSVVNAGPRQKGRTTSDLHAVTALFQAAADEETAQALRVHALPQLVGAFDRALASRADEGDLFFVLKVFAMYGGAEGLNRIVFAARTLPEGYLWSVIFGQIAADDEAFEVVHAALWEPLPRGFAAVAYLDACNSRCREEKLAKHPFDTPEGHSMLRGWLTGEEESFAHSATGAVPFMASGVGAELLPIALGHTNIAVRMEAAWASARLGDPNAVARLIGWCDRPETCWRAEEYLRQLGFEDQIPDAAKAPEFRALSEMAQWLEHPSEFGRAPDELELADAREMYWPPTDDRRVVYAVRYLYRAADAGETDDAGYGMVGSVTFALFGEATAVLTPVQVYALHCCWELEMNEDRRAPPKRSVEAGMAVLRKHNPQLED